MTVKSILYSGKGLQCKTKRIEENDSLNENPISIKAL